MSPESTASFGGVQVEAPNGPIEAATRLLDLHSAGRAAHVHLVNAFTIVSAHEDHRHRSSLLHGAVNFPDGKPLEWISRIRRDAARVTQVRGIELLESLMDAGRAAGLRHYFLGSTDDVLERLVRNARRLYPGVEIVGTFSPPFRDMSDSEVADQDKRIIKADPDIIWVGLGTPKQDHEATRIAGEIRAITVAVGAAFEFLAGTKRQCPKLLSAFGVEWMYRLIQEPRRLWRRYLVGNVRFLWILLRPHIGTALKSGSGDRSI